MADTNELAYFAGFFDGEGSVAIYSHLRKSGPKAGSRNTKYIACLSNTDVRPLQRAKELWGGFISTQLKEDREFAAQDLFRWSVYGHNSVAFLEDIRPFTRCKSEQIDVYLDAMQHVPKLRGEKRLPGANEIIESAATRLKVLKGAA
jgi:hypothetical protein